MVLGCVLWGRAGGALTPLWLHQGEANTCLAVLMPGRWDRVERFRKAQFGEAVQEFDLAMDVVAVDAYLGYYKELTVWTRLREDVIAPALEKGYEEIWLVGTSMGGAGSVIYAEENPQHLAGLYLISPYLGPEEVVAEVQEAGGSLSWSPPEELEEGDIGRGVWKGLRNHQKNQSLPFFLGWGREDRYALGLEMAGDLFDPEEQFIVEGGHDWPTWIRLWRVFLDRVRPCESRDLGR